MSRRGFISTMRTLSREIERADRQRQRQNARSIAEHNRQIRAAERQAKTNAKEAARLYLLSRQEETAEMTQAVLDRDSAISNLLVEALAQNPTYNPLLELQLFKSGQFDNLKWDKSEPKIEDFLPAQLPFLKSFWPGSQKKHDIALAEAKVQFDEANRLFKEAKRKAFDQFLSDENNRRLSVERQNQQATEFYNRVLALSTPDVVDFFSTLLERSIVGDPNALSADIGFSPESKQLVLDLYLPDMSVIPEENSFKYVKASDSIVAVPRPLKKRQSSYSNLICQIVLKCVDAVFRGSPKEIVDALTVNGMLDSIDLATGRNVTTCVVSLRLTRDIYESLNLARVVPEQCLKSLRASVSQSPAEMIPVKPIVELSMIDPRFVVNSDVLGTLDERPNLMDLSPNEFEGLITNLFAKMGLDTRQTRPSRDGGVDCVAFDQRPVFGGKVVIQAKRYKNTVGVSAVRDLFGTTQNEGASKGILVTTSGYGKAAYEFASGKPLELLDGGNLLHLLKEHAGIEAKIIVPDDWKDAPIHGE